MIRPAALSLMVLLLMPMPGRAAESAAGQALFARCKICHTIEAGGRSLVGPNLHGMFGRKAGSLDGFNYSAAMKDSDIVWDDDTLAKYLRDPRGFMPGNKMAFPGIRDDTEIAGLLAYLHAFSPEAAQ
jgi:cytochrome c